MPLCFLGLPEAAAKIGALMRRFLLIFMMVLLPLQWSWAAAASVCAHESGKSHFGHHEHKHGDDSASAQGDGEKGDGASLGAHPDCHVCHGAGAAALQLGDLGQAVWAGVSVLPDYKRHLPDPPVAAFLRPPLNLVA